MPTYEPPALDADIAEVLGQPVAPDPLPTQGLHESLIVSGTVHAVDEDFVYVQLADGQFGRCPLDDATPPGVHELPAPGATVRALLEERIDDEKWAVSIAKGALLDAFRVAAGWKRNSAIVRGRVNLVIRGGFAVEAHGLRCFLPARESGIPRHQVFDAIGREYDFQVIRFDKKDAQPVLSRRSLAAGERRQAEAARIAELEIGQVIEGVVTSVRPFGVFVDLGGVDGLCHVSELSLHHIDSPDEVVAVGDRLTVTVTELDPAKGRVGLSRRDLLGAEHKERIAALAVGEIVSGKVMRVAEFGAFVELPGGVEGLLHVSELSWTGRHTHPGDVLSEGDALRVKILATDPETGRVSLSMRAVERNPWQTLAEEKAPGSIVDGVITRIEDYGLFVQIAEGIDGLCHVSDLTWEGRPARPSDAGDFAVGQPIQVRVLSIDPERGRVSLGLKQVEGDPWDTAGDRVKVGTVFRAPVVRFDDRAAYLQVVEGLEGRLHISQISDERVDSVRAALRIGQEVEVMVTNAERDRRRLDLSIRAVKEKLEAETPKEYHDDDSGMNPLAEALKKTGIRTESED